MTYIMCIHQQCWCSKRFPGFSERKVVWLRSSLNCTSEPYHVIHISYHPLAKHTNTYHIIPHYSMHCTQYHTFVRPHTTSHHTTLYWTAPHHTISPTDGYCNSAMSPTLNSRGSSPTLNSHSNEHRRHHHKVASTPSK